MTIIIFIIILAVLILVHEFGHFIVAKKSGIRVDEFGLGLPPRAWGKQFGETLYSLNWLPFGGFVKIFGEDADVPVPMLPDVETTSLMVAAKGMAMSAAGRRVQASVLIAGITFNIIFAWLLISVGFMIGLPAPVGESPFGQVQNLQTVITGVLPGSPAEKAGLVSGDTILFAEVDGHPVSDFSAQNISQAITQSKSGDVIFQYHRGNENLRTIQITPSADIIPGQRAIGISMDTIGTLKLPFYFAILEGARSTYLLTVATVQGLLHLIGGLFTFSSELSQVTGPIGIAKVVGQASHLGFIYLLSLVALISINLAVINLVPFPALDGGRLLFVLIEAIIRRPIPPVVTRWANGIGFALLLLLMVVVSVHDVFRLL